MPASRPPSTERPLSSTGSHGTFALKTAGMAPCGYTILLQANDRTIVNNLGGPFCYNRWNDIGVGFCLTPPASVLSDKYVE